ncbi:hypothetical protein [Streptomyces tateyamensis]|uniref:hypothetical protein n=1 Tax=Streptomyces tateyamensis TaxID=565073 RepID=UPI0011B405C6|nr:hypothetical protein [Streptomyces tateyamensis]
MGFVLATAGLLVGIDRVVATWHWCLTQDHETNPDLVRGNRAVWVIMLTVLMVLIVLLRPLPKSRWYLLPVLVAATAALTWLYVTGMGHPAPLSPGDAPEVRCWNMPTFPFNG